MADIRINALATTAASTASDDFIAVDGTAQGTRKLSAYSPTFGGNLTVSGTGTVSGSFTASSNVKLGSGTAVALGSQFVVLDGGSEARLQINSTDRPGIYLTAAGANVVTLRGNTTTTELLTTGGTPLSINNSTLATTLAGNLTVSGTGTSSVAGKLLINTIIDDGLGRLQVAGSITATEASGTGLFGFFGGSSLVTGTLGAQSFILRTNNTAALTLDSSQNATFVGTVIAGTWSSSSATKLQAASTANDYVSSIANTASSGNAYALRLHTNLTTASDYLLVASSGAGTGSNKFLVKSNGTINAPSLPTSSAGLSAGDLWVDTAAGNVVKRV